MPIKILFGLVIVALGFSLCFLTAKNSFNGEEYISAKRLMTRLSRDVAATRRDYGMAENLLISTSPLKSISQARLIKSGNYYQLSIGHFSTKNKNGEPVFACQVYDQVTVHYESALNNKQSAQRTPQSLSFELPCKMSDEDIRRIAPINFAPTEILKETPSDGTFPFSNHGEFLVRLQNIEDQWATEWNFKSIQFKDSRSQVPPIEVLGSEVRPIERERLDMEWPETK